MKFARVSRSVVLGIGVMLASSAFAGTRANLQLSNPVKVSGQTIKAGDYELEWNGSGPNVELSIRRGKHVVAKVPARVVEQPTPAAYDAALTWRNDSGPNTLIGIELRGKKVKLELTEGSDDAHGSSK